MPEDFKLEGEKKDSSWYAYVCQHRASNTPCFNCFPDLFEVSPDGIATPKPEAVKENWQEEVVTDVTPGTSDSTSLEE